MARVFFHTAFVGDLLLSIPTLRKLREKYPGDELILVTRPKLGDFFRQHGFATHVFELQKNSRSSVSELRRFLRGFEITEILCPHQSFRTAWILKDIAAVQKISYARLWNFPFFNVRINRIMKWPEALRVLQLYAELDPDFKNQMKKWESDRLFMNENSREAVKHWPVSIPGELSMLVPPQPEDVSRVNAKLKIQSPYVVIAPSSQWLTKKWTKEGFVELVERLQRRGFHCYIIGSLQEKEQCEEVAHSLEVATSQYEVRSVAGQTSLVELHALLASASYAVTNDSGPMHMAAAAGCPVVAIFGPTTLELGYRPWANNAQVAQVDLSCRPCGTHGHNLCPIGTHDCMKKISASEVESMILQKS